MLISGFASGLFDTNCYVLAAAAGGPALVVDPGEDSIGTLEYYFAANDWAPAAVLLTHGHPGHSAAAYDLSAGWNIPVYIHAEDRPLLAAQEFGEPEIVVEVSDGQVLTVGGIDVAVDLIGGHTDGSVAYRVHAGDAFDPVQVVFSGDTLMCRELGHDCDEPGETADEVLAEIARRQLVQAVGAKMLVLEDKTVVMPGHGQSTTIGAERRANPHLKDCS
ncbi:MBL fold metallo-hydrolase [Mycolicibacterium brumae]|uniref:MBL fold metallo-hydrolase n=1 Tax=Mycolicibacterium brumae TaxID=85968 RepID=A0A2G5PD14_9MYCO|nr:MBL fold metallo-hydrolase [Mycolicibacterium brumae]MCV7193575.1 MBL fold metallo-hydrolase [Mycolicibacterium brumae]PIB76208.1 MBL fold metallo-hydrolase [Mycolicibacterium brumae]UWW09152.1 MBL fold metallo-hydrolase [Mycolicibacterium brumae]